MMDPSSDTRRLQRIDAHVHMVGNGFAGSGGWLRLTGWHRWLAGFMLRQLGVPASALEGDLEAIYAEHLGKLVRESSMDAVVLLAHERVHDPDGTPREDLGSMFVPNDVVLGLAKMKCLPNCQNIDFSDKRFRPFWNRMAESGLPLLAHTGGEHTVPVINAALADPRLLRVPLECGVMVIAAHCATKSGAFDRDHFDAWVTMLREFPNLYGDVSAMISLNRCGHLRDCLRDDIAPRILHGSDFPVPVLGHRMWLQGWIDRATFHRCQRIANPLERDWQFKLALGFTEEIAMRPAGLLRMKNQ